MSTPQYTIGKNDVLIFMNINLVWTKYVKNAGKGSIRFEFNVN